MTPYYEKSDYFLQERRRREGSRTRHYNGPTQLGEYSKVPPPPSSQTPRHSAQRADDSFESAHRPPQLYATSHEGHYSPYSAYSPSGDRPSSHYIQKAMTLPRPGSPGPVAGAGDITNTEHGFTIQLDVYRFRPEEIKVVLTDDLLSISGERLEQTADGQALRRSFARKYSIPNDIHLDSIRSHLTDSGFLVVSGSRKGWRETNITSQPIPSRPFRTASVISTV